MKQDLRFENILLLKFSKFKTYFMKYLTHFEGMYSFNFISHVDPDKEVTNLIFLKIFETFLTVCTHTPPTRKELNVSISLTWCAYAGCHNKSVIPDIFAHGIIIITKIRISTGSKKMRPLEVG